MRTLIKIVLGTAFLFFTLEMMLRVIDPWGIQQAMATSRLVFTGYDIQGDTVTLRPGVYDNGDWSYTVLPNGTRQVPASDDIYTCTIAFVGDSVTFGWGVDDDQTFTNFIAQAHPEWRVLNYGVAGYSAVDAYRTLERVDADSVVFLTIDNDAGAPLVSQLWGSQVDDPRTPLLLERYWQGLATTIQRAQQGPEKPSTEYQDTVGAMQALGVQVWAFSDAAIQRDLTNVLYLPPVTHKISRGDPHPDAEGHLEIARLMLADLACTP